MNPNDPRAQLFDAAAEEYEKYRPTYPDFLYDRIIVLSNLSSTSRLLEIGCGTGKATIPFASRGYAIDCVDPGENLVAIAKERCRHLSRVKFIVGTFEAANLKKASYDLIYSAQAFHWIDPNVR